MEYVILNTRDGTFYQYMENGKPECGERNAAEFDEEMSAKVCGQLVTFKGDVDWRPIQRIAVGPLLVKYKTQKATAEAIGCSESSVRQWIKDGRVSLGFLLRAHKANDQPTSTPPQSGVN